MASTRLPRMRGGSNSYSPLPGTPVRSLSHGSELWAPSPFFLPLMQHDVPVDPRFLRRPRLLTRLHAWSASSTRRGLGTGRDSGQERSIAFAACGKNVV
jgi:hypothetical protein